MLINLQYRGFMQKLYVSKSINFGFVIICPSNNIGQIKTTINSIKHIYHTEKYICVVPEECHVDDLKEMNKFCCTIKGGDTITSLINAGMDKATCNEWNFLVIAGTWIRGGLDKKYSYFIESEKDILFPIVDRQTNFVDGSINGFLMHKKGWKEIGHFPSDNPLEICKLMWTMDAIDKGYKFKAVLGTAIN